jgi:hypothetical protein
MEGGDNKMPCSLIVITPRDVRKIFRGKAGEMLMGVAATGKFPKRNGESACSNGVRDKTPF